MKKIVCLLVAIVICSSTWAQDNNIKERKFSFSVGYKVGFEMTSYLKNTSTGIKYDMNNGSVGPIYHFVSLDFNYAITPKWEVGLATGLNETHAGVVMLPIYANAQYFFNDRTRGWFVSGDLGTNINVDMPSLGLLTSVGGGYRLYIADKFKMDFSLGYMYSTAGTDKDWRSRQSAIQLGVALVF